MHRPSRLALTTALVVFTCLLAGCASPTPTSTATSSTSLTASTPTASAYPADTATAIRNAATTVMTANNIPGAIVLLQTPEGRFEEPLGVSDKATNAPLAIDDHLRIGSITKTMTVTLVLQLVDQKKVDLDTPARAYLPELPETWKDVTVRQLAEMRSGIPSYTGTPTFDKEFLADSKRQFTPAELLAMVEPLSLLFTPGTNFDYSNTNTVILGQLIERISGTPYASAMQNLFDSAGLAHTTYAEAAAAFTDPRAQGYTNLTADGTEADATEWNASWAQAAGAAASTAGDLETWLHELTTGSLLSPQTQKERLSMINIPGNPTGTGYGLGILATNGWTGHSGDLPGYSSTMYARDDGSVLIVLTTTNILVNRADGTPIPPSAAIAEAVSAVAVPNAPFVFPRVGA
ncbi:serine hydrolase domain-containing protein [Subtercola sp. YIM 133946]|uniref:serine hydrolase domain-containing protein n=1 Tax=Subtercola sp. YIM 133946 TaxID=3118909 RepID=UPI002F93059B